MDSNAIHFDLRKLDTHDTAADIEMYRQQNSDIVVVTPGQVIASGSGFLRGHGTYINKGELVASVAGVVEKVNQLISVRPLKSRYIGEVGDIVVGRISAVGNKLWRVDVHGHQDAVLMLTSVNLPTGAQRRRTYEDQLEMRSLLAEGDLISAEVQEVRYDGTLSLHTRSLRYGKLENGQFVTAAPALIKRLKQHIVQFPNGTELILGTNGYLWITRAMAEDDDMEEMDDTRAEVLLAKRKRHAESPMSDEDRLKIAQIYRSITYLNQNFQTISPDSIIANLQ